MKFVKEFIVPAAVLTIICVVVSAALVTTYNVTEPIIEAAKIAEATAARSEVLADAEGFEEIEADIEGISDIQKDTGNKGYVITSVAMGYAGDLEVMVGINNEGEIVGIKLLSNEESKPDITKPEYQQQYIGKKADLEGVDAIAGATVSSKAFRSAVENAFVAFDAVTGA